MTRAGRVGVLASIFTVLYLLAFSEILTVPFIDDTQARQILPVIPWWFLVSFGSYSLWSLGMGLFTFRDCKDAHTELLQEITQAKNDLRLRGITVD